MGKFRKRPVVIEAVQFRWGNPEIEGVTYPPTDGKYYIGDAYIETLEGRMIVSDGDWVITGVNGEKYPCKPDIFEKTYEAVEKVNSTDPVDDGALPALRSALKKLTDQKSGERTPKDRYIAIAITDLEKLIAFVAMYC